MQSRRYFLVTTALYACALSIPALAQGTLNESALSPQERLELRRRLGRARTAEERERIRREFFEQRSAGTGSTGGDAAPSEPGTSGTTESRLSERRQEEMRRRLRSAETEEERNRIRQEYDVPTERTTDRQGSTTPPEGRSSGSTRTDTAGDIDDELPPDGGVLTKRERDAFKARMRAANSKEERKRIKEEHKRLVQSRAHQRGQGFQRSGGKGKGGSGQQGQGTVWPPQQGKRKGGNN